MAKRIPNHLQWTLGVPTGQLVYIADHISRFYGRFEKPKLCEDGSPKLKGGIPQSRVIYPPKNPLKEIQRRIKRHLLDQISIPRSSHGWVKGFNNIKHAQRHLGKKYRFVTDLSDFFPTVTPQLVYSVFDKYFNYPPDIVRLLTRLTTFKYQLPQGTPTSPALANIVFAPVDIEIEVIADKIVAENGRFGDDLVLSSSRPIAQETIDRIIALISINGFQINNRKTHYTAGKAFVTGIEVGNNSMRIRANKQENLRNIDLPIKSRLGIARYALRVNPRNQRARDVVQDLQNL